MREYECVRGEMGIICADVSVWVCGCESVCGYVNVSERGSVSDFERESERIESELVSAWLQ